MESDKSLGNLRVYQSALKLSESAWQIYIHLSKEHRSDMGSQWIRSTDSIGANIAEGYGRYHYKDKIKFYYNARGSLWEGKHWLLLLYKRLYKRLLISEEEFQKNLAMLNAMGKQLNAFIATTGNPNDQ